jgi:hypothetical protein
MVQFTRTTVSLFALACLLVAGCSKPSWTTSDHIFEERGDQLFFRGEVLGVHDLALARRQAEADAKKRLIEKVRTQATIEFRELTRGGNTVPGDVGRFAEDLIATVANVSVSGVTPVKSYWEEMPESRKDGSPRIYHVYALVTISKRELDAAAKHLVTATLEQGRADREVERLLDAWKRRQESQPLEGGR